MLTGMMHNFFPHVHYEYEGQSHAGSIVSSDHHDLGEHSHHPAEGDSREKQQSLLDFLFNDHTHVRHYHKDAPAIIERTKSPKPVEHSSIIPFYNLTSIIWGIPDAKQEFDLVVDVGKEDPLLLHKPLRGPPYLG